MTQNIASPRTIPSTMETKAQANIIDKLDKFDFFASTLPSPNKI